MFFVRDDNNFFYALAMIWNKEVTVSTHKLRMLNNIKSEINDSKETVDYLFIIFNLMRLCHKLFYFFCMKLYISSIVSKRKSLFIFQQFNVVFRDDV